MACELMSGMTRNGTPEGLASTILNENGEYWITTENHEFHFFNSDACGIDDLRDAIDNCVH